MLNDKESTAIDILQRIMMIGDEHATLFALDTELAAGTFTDPFQPVRAKTAPHSMTGK